MIKTNDGEEIGVGKVVYSIDPKTGKVRCGTVTEIFDVGFPGVEGTVERPIVRYRIEMTHTPKQLFASEEKAKEMATQKENETSRRRQMLVL
ncbi:MAG: hypothetical protein ACW96M_05385 [Candidatus Thorarchaeota archaeon]|jgi:hypothetical protein